MDDPNFVVMFSNHRFKARLQKEYQKMRNHDGLNVIVLLDQPGFRVSESGEMHDVIDIIIPSEFPFISKLPIANALKPDAHEDWFPHTPILQFVLQEIRIRRQCAALVNVLQELRLRC